MILSLVAVIFTLGLVILLHEFGHFVLCKKFGVRVEKFAFGFGPELFGVTYAGTRFSVCAFPLGGFVKPAGENIEETTGQPDEYFAQPWFKRLAIVYAGPVMNYILAFTLFTGVVFVKGMPEAGTEPVIGNMMVGFPADSAGIRVDDRITKVNGREVKDWEELASTIHKNPETEVELTVQRGDENLTKKVTPKKDETSGKGVIGIMPRPVYKAVTFDVAAREGVKQCYELTRFTISTIVSKIYKRQRPDLAGPVGIVQMVSRAAHSGLDDLVFLIGLLSVAIGFFNFLPVPLLDGGHGAMYLWEGLSGRKLTPNAMSKANGVGIVFLLSLLLFATYNDLLRIRDERVARKKAAAAAVQPERN
jgi:regulator of sigma E protease